MKKSDSYDSLIRGVSQQVPHDRVVGQHWEQDNLISDPVRGLSRRHGSQQMDQSPLAGAITAEDTEDAANRVEQTVFVEGTEYAMHHRSGNYVGSQIHPLVIVNKDTKKFVPVVHADAGTLTMLSEGVSSIAAAGRFVVLASANRPVQYTLTDNTLPSAPLHVVWVRGGANSRTFKVFVTIAGVTQTFAYTTLPAYYQGALDTSDILPYNDPPTNSVPNPLYGKLVNDRANAYNTAVSQHIAAVALDIAPANIALKLANLMIAAGYTGVVADGPYIRIGIADAVITVDDGGNGDFMRAVSHEITAAELVTPRHYDGKVVKVAPKQANSLAFYLKAKAVSGVPGEFGEVVWSEVAGIGVALDWIFAVGVFISGTFYVAQNPTALATLIGQPVPIIEPTSSGDLDSSPIPEFFGRIITYMRMFQDRLMIVAGSTVFMSKSGDYFNFFRKSSLALANDDPIEVFAQGTEDDIITSGVQHDRNVILFGQRYQYIVPGRENMTPNNPYVGVQATYEDANLTTPSVAGSLLFFCQRREGRLTLQQMSPGSVADRLDAFDVSSQLDGYLTGDPRQIVAMTAPSVVFVRTKDLLHGFYVYSFLDSSDQAERRFDSWSRWVFDPSLGALMGISQDDSGLLAVTVRATSEGTALVLDRFSRETEPSDFPYLDSQELADGTTHSGENACVAFDNTTERHLLGTSLALRADIESQFPTELGALRAGTLYDSFATLTSPYIRDRDDKIILDARLTISKLTVSLSNTAAVVVTLSGDRGVTWRPAKSWIYRPVGLWVLNTQSVAEGAVITAPVMKENSAYRAKISSRSWLPLTISVVEWAGQAFTSRG
jgi:hypothetical protein